MTVLKMSIETGLSFFMTFCCIITPIPGIIDNCCIMENFKNLRKNQNKLRTIYPKNHKYFKSSKPTVQFYWFLQKKSALFSIFLSLSFLNFCINLYNKLDFESNFGFYIRDNIPVLRLIEQLFDHLTHLQWKTRQNKTSLICDKKLSLHVTIIIFAFTDSKKKKYSYVNIHNLFYQRNVRCTEHCLPINI